MLRARRQRQDVVREWTEQLDVERKCYRCGGIFTLRTALGRLQCRYHEGPYQLDARPLSRHGASTYACCGTSLTPTHPRWDAARLIGCSHVDHSDVLFACTDTDTTALYAVPSELYTARIIQPLPETLADAPPAGSASYIDDTNTVWIRRYERRFTEFV